MKMYQVGGAVRDEILGVPSKDIDFTVVLDEFDTVLSTAPSANRNPFEFMVQELKNMGFKIFLETPQYLTVRAQFPKDANALVQMFGGSGLSYQHLTADFVLARKESDYTDGRRPDHVEPGTLEDDLARRDFTINAIARDTDGNLIDPFDGQGDIDRRIIRCVGDPKDRLNEDALRAVRALRFSVTKGFSIDASVAWIMESARTCDAVKNKISDERIAVEVSKMFQFDTIKAIKACADYPRLSEAMFSGRVRLEASMKRVR